MKRRLQIAAGKVALLCIDLQEEHRQDKRYLVNGFDQVLANVQALQAAARGKAVPLIHAAYVVDSAKGKPRPFHPVMADGSSAFSNKDDPLSALCAETAPLPGERVIIKDAASVFSDVGFAAGLRSAGIDWLVIAGVWTEACIDATVKDAVAEGFRVMLVKDACGSASIAMHQTGILNLANRLYGGVVTDTRQARRALGGEAIDAWMVEGSVPLRFTYENAAALYDQL
ncbi:MAG TPA: isochorismatase family protein [Terriglobales bacterium]|nr:isochorismatase family protein [Terriglobales bacterium]